MTTSPRNHRPPLHRPGRAEAAERRRSRRRPIPRVRITIAESGNPVVTGLADAVDINQDGLGLVLTSDFEPGREILLSFELDGTARFHRLPAVVLRQELGVGAVQFERWSEQERRRLRAHLM